MTVIDRDADDGRSIRQILADWDDDQVDEWLRDYGLDPIDLVRSWQHFWARPKQIEPDGDWWTIWALITGRGFGKTRTGAEWVLDRIEAGAKVVGLVGRTTADVRQVMVQGLLAAAKGRGIRARFVQSQKQIRFEDYPDVECHTYTAEEPGSLRGPNFDTVWADEYAQWSDVVDEEGNTAASNIEFGLRGRVPGLVPRMVITTTPRRIPKVVDLFLRAGEVVDDERYPPERVDTVITEGSTDENRDNLDAQFVRRIHDRFEGTRMGDQELHGKLLDSGGERYRRTWWTAPREDGSGNRMLTAAWNDGVTARVRYWDLASTEPSEQNHDPDWTAGALIAWSASRGAWAIEDIVRFRGSAAKVREIVAETAELDRKRYGRVVYAIEEEKGAAGKNLNEIYARDVIRPLGVPFDTDAGKISGDKVTRSEPVETVAEQGKLWVVEGPWNRDWFAECELFPGGNHDDQVDAVSGAYNALRGQGGPAEFASVTGQLPDPLAR